MQIAYNISAIDLKHISGSLETPSFAENKNWECKNVNNRARKRRTASFCHKSGPGCEIMH